MISGLLKTQIDLKPNDTHSVTLLIICKNPGLINLPIFSLTDKKSGEEYQLTSIQKIYSDYPLLI